MGVDRRGRHRLQLLGNETAPRGFHSRQLASASSASSSPISLPAWRPRRAMFGEDAVLQLVRVMGAAMARLADAIVSAFLVNVESQVQDQDPVGLGVARANAEAIALLPTVNGALDVLLLQHTLAARRTILGGAGDIGYEIQPLCVGFVELVGSTALAQRLSTRELGSVPIDFEQVAAH